MLDDTRWPAERFGFASLVVLTLSPVCLQGIWRPLAQGFSVEGDTFALTLAGLVVASCVLVGHAVGRLPNMRPGVVGAAAALTLGGLVGTDAPAIILMVLALLWIAAAANVAAPMIMRVLPTELDGLARRYPTRGALFFAFAVVTVVLTTRLSAFMGDATQVGLSLVPQNSFLVHHSCLTAYIEGARLAADGAQNLYDIARWPSLNGAPQPETPTGPYAPFSLDAFAYPPPFLLIPHTVLSWFHDFSSQRALWFTLNGVLVAAGLGIVAKWLGGRVGLVALVLAPAVWSSGATLGTLQVGNVHLAIMVAAMLALVAFERTKFALGGALLAFAILSKISPGILVLLLLMRGRFREVIWTAAFSCAFLGLGIAAFGVAPLVDFVSYELPRLSSGEALTFLTGADTVPLNLAPFGVPFKLTALGIEIGAPWAAARLISTVFTVFLLVLAVVAGRAGRGPKATAEVWAALLTLASLRSPLAPGYVAFALLWLLSIRAADVRGRGQTVGFAAIWLSISIVPPLTGHAMIYHSIFQQVLIVLVATYCILRPSKSEGPSEA